MSKKKKDLIIISLGGSLIAPKEIDFNFLKKFRDLILNHLKNKIFFIYVGGGKISRIYQKTLKEFGGNQNQLDWLGIKITRLNAYLIKQLFKVYAYPKIITDPNKKIKLDYAIYTCGGWKPGWSTDYDAVLLAKNLKVKTVLNLTDIDYVYEKDPQKFKDAKPFKKLSWNQYLNLIQKEWQPGLSTPFDPLASKLAQKLKIKVIIINGKNLKQIDNYLNKKSFIGTIIG